MLGKIEDKRRWGQQRMRWLESISDSMDLNSSKLQETVKDRGACVLHSMGLQRVTYDVVTEQQPSGPGTAIAEVKRKAVAI